MNLPCTAPLVTWVESYGGEALMQVKGSDDQRWQSPQRHGLSPAACSSLGPIY
jgi:hypothetical protein